jgi:hypothetical protein
LDISNPFIISLIPQLALRKGKLTIKHRHGQKGPYDKQEIFGDLHQTGIN